MKIITIDRTGKATTHLNIRALARGGDGQVLLIPADRNAPCPTVEGVVKFEGELDLKERR